MRTTSIHRMKYVMCAVTMAGVSMFAFAATKPPADKPVKSETAKMERIGDPYPLDNCIVSGEKLGSMGKPVVKIYDGREVRFCCNGCVGDFEKDKAKFMKLIDDEIIKQQMTHYPLTNCLVMEDAKLDDNDPDDHPVNLVYGNRLVRFCCKKCVRQFKSDPQPYLRKLDAAVVQQQKSIYPLDTCPISGEKLGDDAVDHVYGISLVRFCCKNCVAKFEEDPLPTMAKLREAWSSKHHTSNETTTDAHGHDDHDHH